VKILAREVRAEFGLTTPRVLRSDLRRIYKKHGIKIDLWPLKAGGPGKLRNIRGAYFNDKFGPCVMIDRRLPDDPRVFTMAHELKHHLLDKDWSVSYCGTDNENTIREISAEVFAAEFIYPEGDFARDLEQRGIVLGQCIPIDLVRLKHDTQTTLSYTGLAKRAVFLNFAPIGIFDKIQWKKLEEQVYGVPFYKIRLQR
jgi:Zn-dependent peptidase ImmA (M78 family)